MARAGLKQPAVLFRLTSEEFCQLPPGEQVELELIDGEVTTAARPAPSHQHFVFQLGIVIDQWIKAHRLGRVLLDTLMKLDQGWTPAPDICYLARNHLRRVQKQRIVGPVDLAVEVLSLSTSLTDRRAKFSAYARFGIPWYWMVNLRRRFLEEYELVKMTYSNRLRVPFDQEFSPRLFSGLTIKLASLEW